MVDGPLLPLPLTLPIGPVVGLLRRGGSSGHRQFLGYKSNNVLEL